MIMISDSIIALYFIHTCVYICMLGYLNFKGDGDDVRNSTCIFLSLFQCNLPIQAHSIKEN